MHVAGVELEQNGGLATQHGLCEECMCTSIGVWHPLDGVAMLGNVHDRHPWHLPDPSLQVSVTGSHHVALVLWWRRRTSVAQGHCTCDSVNSVNSVVNLHHMQPSMP